MTNKLSYQEQRALYESIMSKVAKQVKNMLNEDSEPDRSKENLPDDKANSDYKKILDNLDLQKRLKKATDLYKENKMPKLDYFILQTAYGIGHTIETNSDVKSDLFFERSLKVLDFIEKSGKEKEFFQMLKKIFAELKK